MDVELCHKLVLMDNLRLLRTYLAVVDEGSMSEAAVALGCSGPAVSQQVTRLEKELGVRLLERLPQGVMPTAAGDVLVRHARKLLDDEREMRDAVRAVDRPGHGRLRITAFSSASAHLLPPALAQLRRSHPEVAISLVDSDWTRPFDVLLGRGADVTVVPEFDFVPLAVPPGITIRPVGTDPFRLAVSEDSELAGRRRVRFADLRDVELIAYTARFPHTATLRHAAASAGFTPRIAAEVDDFDVIPTLVAAGAGCAVATSMMLAGMPASGLTVKPLEAPAIARRVFVATRTDAPSAFASDMLAVLRSTLRAIVAAR